VVGTFVAPLSGLLAAHKGADVSGPVPVVMKFVRFHNDCIDFRIRPP